MFRILKGLIAVTVVATLPHATASAQQRRMSPEVFYGHLAAVLEDRAERAAQIETASVLNRMTRGNVEPLKRGDARTLCYLDFGNYDKFLALAARGTKSVVVDPDYLNGAGFDVQALYQNLNTMSRVIQRLDSKYSAHVILMQDLAPAGTDFAADSTQLHESIHSAAFAIERMDLDRDGEGHDAPEYLSDQLFKHQRLLLTHEARAWNAIRPLMDRIVEFQSVDASEAEISLQISNLVREIYFAASTYRDAIEDIYQREYIGNSMGYNWQEAAQLVAYWDGKVDWEGLRRDVNANVDFLQALGQSLENGADGNDAATKRFVEFFFQRRCMAN